MKIVNGWSQEEISLLSKRTGYPEEVVLNFCQAIDKHLYLMLPTETRKATLHFHLKAFQPKESKIVEPPQESSLPATKPIKKTRNKSKT
jgi:hypothetical protein